MAEVIAGVGEDWRDMKLRRGRAATRLEATHLMLGRGVWNSGKGRSAGQNGGRRG